MSSSAVSVVDATDRFAAERMAELEREAHRTLDGLVEMGLESIRRRWLGWAPTRSLPERAIAVGRGGELCEALSECLGRVDGRQRELADMIRELQLGDPERASAEAELARLSALQVTLGEMIDRAGGPHAVERARLLALTDAACSGLIHAAVVDSLRRDPPATAREFSARVAEGLGDPGRAARIRRAGEEPYRQAARLTCLRRHPFGPSDPVRDPLDAYLLERRQLDAITGVSSAPQVPRPSRSGSLAGSLGR